MELQIDKECGYYFYNAPSKEELDAHYKERYFQSNDIYTHHYSEQEIQFFRESSLRKIHLIQDARGIETLDGLRVLEIGVGEGWGLASLLQAGAEVIGVDYTQEPARNHNPDVADLVIAGQPEDLLQTLISDHQQFDIVWMDNVLEHVPTPKTFLNTVNLLLKDESHMITEVPNDFSALQQFASSNSLISKQFWLAYPEHLSYFSSTSLDALLRSAGFATIDLIADFPIDFFLLNGNSNYVDRPNTGKEAHLARLRAEHLLMGRPRNDVVDFYRSLATVGLGRNLVNLSERQQK